VAPSPLEDLSAGAIDPIVAAFGDEARPADDAPPAQSRARRPLVVIGIAAAAALIAGAAIAGAELLQSEEQRPQVLPEQSYRDADAGFTLRYPDGWRVLRRDPGDGIRFAIGAPGAPTTDTNTVSVVVGPEAAALPPLHTLSDQLTETLREELPGVRLELAERTRLADAPAFRFAFRDPDATPPTRIEQYVGRTTSGRPLTVTVTVREPRTAPTEAELSTFVESLDPV
jgi:catechol 2,3-dioxygenase-like lactoylglutathione lyase family enzyme